MTFTYTPSDTPSDTTRVRFRLEDTQSPGLLSDEEISMAIAEAGTWQTALTPCCNLIMAKLAKESGVTMDWLKIDRAQALKFYGALKTDLEREFGAGVRGVTASAVSVTRSDYDNG